MTGRRNPLYERLADLEVGGRAVLVQGVDFDADPEYQRSNIHHAMKQRGIGCKTVRHNQQITVTITSREN